MNIKQINPTKPSQSKNQFIASGKGYQQVSFHIKGKLAQKFSDFWMNFPQLLAVSFEDENDKYPVFGEPRNFAKVDNFHEVVGWQDCLAKILFDDKVDIEEYLIKYFSNKYFAATKLVKYEKIAAGDWLKINRGQFKPIILKKISIITNWHKPIKNRINIKIDPGMAFGSGSHQTTQLILRHLEVNYKKLSEKNILDYGCGSGILGIAAAHLSQIGNGKPAKITMTDIDKNAVIVSKKNAKINKINSKISLPPQIIKVKNKYDIILANILLTPIINLQNTFAKLLTDDGVLLISGILDYQFQNLKAAYQKKFRHIEIIDNEDDWLLVEVIK